MDTKQEDLARAVATEMGSDVAKETETMIRQGTGRPLGLGLTESVAIGAFIMQTVQLAIQVYQVVKDRAELLAKLDAQALRHSKLDETKRSRIIESIVDKLPRQGL
jgi:heme exporter protein D